MPVGPIPAREPAHTACEHELRRAVLVGDLPAGQRLPPERELSATLGVSRLTLRSALATLTAQGVLTVRHGSGYIVQDVRRTGGPDLLPGLTTLAQARGDLPAIATELLRVRRHLARAVLEHLAEHAPRTADVRAYTRAVDAFAAIASAAPPQALRSGVGASEASAAGATPARSAGDILDALAAADLSIVESLLDATRSPVLRLCLNPVIAVVSASQPLRAAMYRAPDANVLGWRALGAWLAAPTAASIEKVIAVLADRDRKTYEHLKRSAR